MIESALRCYRFREEVVSGGLVQQLQTLGDLQLGAVEVEVEHGGAVPITRPRDGSPGIV